jgi:hypothetical protein
MFIVLVPDEAGWPLLHLKDKYHVAADTCV